MDALTIVLILVVGLAAGAGIGWLLAGRDRSATQATIGTLSTERDAVRAERDELRGERDRLRGEHDEARRLAAEAQAAHAAVLATLEAERQATAAALETERRNAEEKLADLETRFVALSRQIVEENNKNFLQVAEERFKRTTSEQSAELQKREKAVETLVKPLSESLTKVQEHVAKVEVERARAHSELLTQIETMRTSSEQIRIETQQLTTALRRPQVRGQWGEEMLRRTVEASGMVKHVHFTEQVSVTDDDGAVQRPDLVVHLSEGKHVVVDSKVSFNGFLEAMEATDDAIRAERLKAHARHLRTHVDQLAAKEYWAQFESTPEFVVLFVPADTFLNAALEQEPTLMEHAFARNVVIATPSTLVALLRTIGYAWRQEALARNAHDVLKLGKDLHGRIATMGGYIATLGKSLDRSVAAFNQTVGSLETRVLVPARKLADLGLVDKELDPIAPVESVTRALQRDELLASANESLVTLPEPSDDETDERASG